MQLENSPIRLGRKIEKKLQVRIDDKYDVVVAGGGVTGLIAALAASRLGARVLLVERKNFIGGNAAMGLQILGSHTTTGIRATAGIPGEFLRRLKALGAASDAVRDARVCSLIAVEPAWVKILALQMLEEAGVDVWLHSSITDALCAGWPSPGCDGQRVHRDPGRGGGGRPREMAWWRRWPGPLSKWAEIMTAGFNRLP